MLLQPTGGIGPCCYHFGYSLGNLQTADMAEIWNGARMRKLRREFLEGNIRICKSRMHNLACHKNFDSWGQEVAPREIMPEPPRRLDVRLNGQCNLSCVMCDVWQQPNGRYDQTSFWQEGPRDIFPHLKEIEMLGGEPMIQSDTYRLVREVTPVNPHCRWSFVTNAHYNWTPRLQDLLQSIALDTIQISIDSLDPATYATIRKGGDLARTLATVQRYIQFREQRSREGRPFVLKFSQCILRNNWRETPAFLRFCRDHGAVPDLQFAFYDPSASSSLSLASQDEIRAILCYWQEHADPSDAVIIQPIREILGRILQP